MSKLPRKRQLWPDVFDFKAELNAKTKKSRDDTLTFPNSDKFFALKNQKKKKEPYHFNNSFVQLDETESISSDSNHSSDSVKGLDNNTSKLDDISESDVDSIQENIKSSTDFENTSDFSASQKTIENNSQTFIEKHDDNSVHISECDTQWSDLVIENYEDIDKVPTNTEVTASIPTKAFNLTPLSTTTPSKPALSTQMLEETYDSGKKKKIKFIKGGLAEKLHLLLEKQKRDKLFKDHKYKVMNERQEGIYGEVVECLVESNGVADGHMVFYDCEITNSNTLHSTFQSTLKTSQAIETASGQNSAKQESSKEEIDSSKNLNESNNKKCCTFIEKVKKAKLLVTKETSQKRSITASCHLKIHPPWLLLPMTASTEPVLFGIDVTND